MSDDMRYRTLLVELAAVAATCKRRNERGWLEYMAAKINRVLEAVGDKQRVRYVDESGEFEVEAEK